MSQVNYNIERPEMLILRTRIGWLCHAIHILTFVWLSWLFYLNFASLINPSQTALEWNLYWGLEAGTVTVNKVYLNRAISALSYIAAFSLGLAVSDLISGYLRSDVLSSVSARRLKLVGIYGMVAAIVDVLIRPLLVGILSAENFKHYSEITDWVVPHDLLFIVIALFTVALAHIQGTAAAISDEYKQIV